MGTASAPVEILNTTTVARATRVATTATRVATSPTAKVAVMMVTIAVTTTKVVANRVVKKDAQCCSNLNNKFESIINTTEITGRITKLELI